MAKNTLLQFINVFDTCASATQLSSCRSKHTSVTYPLYVSFCQPFLALHAYFATLKDTILLPKI